MTSRLGVAALSSIQLFGLAGAVTGGAVQTNAAAPVIRTAWGVPDLRGTYHPIVPAPRACGGETPSESSSRGLLDGSTTITQSRDFVIMLNQGVWRVVPLRRARHGEGDTGPYLGHPRGWWDDDTLVIELAPTPVSTRDTAGEGGAVLERLSVVDRNTLHYELVSRAVSRSSSPVIIRATLIRAGVAPAGLTASMGCPDGAADVAVAPHAQ